MVSDKDIVRYNSFLHQITILGKSYRKDQVDYFVAKLRDKVPKKDWKEIKNRVVNPWKDKLIITRGYIA